jgi:hypothetical protein
MHGVESNKLGPYLIKFGKRFLMIKWMAIIHWFFTLTLNDHVVYNHTTVHHLPYLRFRPYKSRAQNNDKTMLEHIKALAFRKISSLLWVGDCLHKCNVWGIDTIT